MDIKRDLKTTLDVVQSYKDAKNRVAVLVELAAAFLVLALVVADYTTPRGVVAGGTVVLVHLVGWWFAMLACVGGLGVMLLRRKTHARTLSGKWLAFFYAMLVCIRWFLYGAIVIAVGAVVYRHDYTPLGGFLAAAVVGLAMVVHAVRSFLRIPRDREDV